MPESPLGEPDAGVSLVGTRWVAWEIHTQRRIRVGPRPTITRLLRRRSGNQRGGPGYRFQESDEVS